MSEDTIAALASAPGASSLAVLRLSGPAAIALASGIAHPARGTLAGAAPGRVVAVSLDLEGVAVPARAAVFRAPRSYTREDLVEIALPGSPPLAASVLAALLSSPPPAPPLRLARPGEFTLRAFRSGRIDLSQAEAVALLIGATSEAEGRAAHRQLRGELRDRVGGISREVIEALALLEAALDFPDEDLPQIRSEVVEKGIDGVLRSIDGLRETSAIRLPDTGALRAALWGFPNAGKSSLLNALLGRPAAIVHGSAGTTRDPIRGVARAPGGRAIEWIDLAGREGPPGEPAEAGDGDLERAVARLTGMELEGADLVVWVVDGAAAAAPRSREAFAALAAPRKLLVINKADLLGPEAIRGYRSLPERPVVVSALSGEGIEELAARAAERGGGAEPPQFLVTARQEAALARARAAAARAREALRRGEGYELAAVDLREAHGALEELTGREVGERILDAVFGRFCVGK